MPKFASTIKNLLSNKEKLFEMAKTPSNENCSAVLLKQLPEKLGDPGKFLIPCIFPGMVECFALADLSASINLMPHSVWKKLSLPELTPTCMTLELANRSISHPLGIAEDVFVKVGKFHFPTDFVIVDFDVDPRVPLILGRGFLRTGHALIDVFDKEITLRVGNEAITFNLDQTSRYSSNYDSAEINRIDDIDVASEEYSQEILGFTDNSLSGNLTPSSQPIIANYSPSLTPFDGSDFILEEIEAFLKSDSIPDGIDNQEIDPERDILLLEKLLNEDPSPPPVLPQKLHNEEIKYVEKTNEFPEVELKDLPPHLEYAFLEGGDKLPVIIAKDLSDEEKAAPIKVLKSHKQAIAWKLSDIKGINPEFCTHKILMEDDFKPAVQQQRRVNPKIHEVIKQEDLKLLDAGLIYPISDSPWVSPIHCVPKKGGITVVTNDENELIPTRLLNDATRKDHFPLPFMDQMLERLAGNEYYCFLDGFSGYFQIPIDPQDQEKTTFTVPYGTFAYRRKPFGLGNAPGTFQRCMMAIFHDMIGKTMEKSHFMVKEGIVLGHKISKNGIEVDRAKVDVIAKLPHPTTVKGVRSFLGHAGFYRRFIQDFSKIARPMTHLLEKDAPFIFSPECIEAFQTLKKKLTEAPILFAPDWDLHFELMCDASDFAIEISAVLNLDQMHSVYGSSALKYLFAKQDAKPILLRWVLILQEFDIIIRDKKGAENLAADHLSRLENPHQDVFEKKEINETFPLETLNAVSFRGDSTTPWFADFANYHAGNFVVKGMSSQQKNKFDETKNVTFLGVGTCLKGKNHKRSISGVFRAEKVRKYNKNSKRTLKNHREGGRLTLYKVTNVRIKVKSRIGKILVDGPEGFVLQIVTPSNQGRQIWKPAIMTTTTLIYSKSVRIKSSGGVFHGQEKAWISLRLVIGGPTGHHSPNYTPRRCLTPVSLCPQSTKDAQTLSKLCDAGEKTKKIHDSKIKNRVFNVCDRVLLFNYRLKIFSGKLKTRWSGPFTVTKVFPYGTVELSQPDGPNFRVNGHRLKHYFGRTYHPWLSRISKLSP
ncbi:hypothetical protein CTI12_AA065210 [Artemisia annua]|uniref:Reverse transcriptase domain-containing protein n=1 Tax=Artemisia annua TaxID=35608 RepID=A0A2U1Q7D3_ARTAN|nr:hypothetical protein CTI12_AA065210 [Artemisia annua]